MSEDLERLVTQTGAQESEQENEDVPPYYPFEPAAAAAPEPVVRQQSMIDSPTMPMPIPSDHVPRTPSNIDISGIGQPLQPRNQSSGDSTPPTPASPTSTASRSILMDHFEDTQQLAHAETGIVKEQAARPMRRQTSSTI